MRRSSHRNFRRFPDEERRSWQNPEAILESIGLKPGDVFVDIGCGYGFFTLPAAGIVGLQGRVIGIDVNKEWLESLKYDAIRRGLNSVDTIIGRAEETIPLEKSADVVFLGMVLHDFDNPTAVLRNAHRMLKRTGTLANLDWNKESPIGPPFDIRLEAATEASMISGEGFEIISTTSQGPYHYLIIARPKEAILTSYPDGP